MMRISEMIKYLSEKLTEEWDKYMSLNDEEVYYKVWIDFTSKKDWHYETWKTLKEQPEKLPTNKSIRKFMLIEDYIEIDNIFKFD